MNDTGAPDLVYELWCVRPANMIADFLTAAATERMISSGVREKGMTALQNHAILLTGNDGNVVDSAEGDEIPECLAKRRQIEEGSQESMTRIDNMIHELWDIRSNNIVDAYDSFEEAVDALTVAVKTHGQWTVEYLMLLKDDPHEESKTIVGMGSELLALINDKI